MMEKINFIYSFKSDGLGGASLRHVENIEKVEICRDDSGGKNLITLEINGELVFSYDSNFKGQSVIKNGIQMPFED